MTRSETHIVAMGSGGFSDEEPALDRFILDLTGGRRPRVCFLPTASGDALAYRMRFAEAFPPASFDTSVLRLFERDVSDLESFLGEQDVVYVGGGNTANMLAVWRLHGVDVALEAAWGSGVVLAGLSAGANCWFESSTTDPFLLGRADPLADGLGFLSGSFCPHYDSEPSRRREFLRLAGEGILPPGLAWPAMTSPLCTSLARSFARRLPLAPGLPRTALRQVPGAGTSRRSRPDPCDASGLGARSEAEGPDGRVVPPPQVHLGSHQHSGPG